MHMGTECHHADGAHPGLKGVALNRALSAAENRCAATQERLTTPRRRVLELLRYQQELRDPAELDLPTGSLADYKVSKQELAMAETLLEAMSADWNPAEFEDEYRGKLREFIESKAHGEERVPIPEAPEAEPTKVVDIMSVLKRSLAEKGRGAKGRAEPAKAAAGTRKKTAKKTAGKTAKKPAARAAGKKTAAKKTPSRARKAS